MELFGRKKGKESDAPEQPAKEVGSAIINIGELNRRIADAAKASPVPEGLEARVTAPQIAITNDDVVIEFTIEKYRPEDLNAIVFWYSKRNGLNFSGTDSKKPYIFESQFHMLQITKDLAKEYGFITSTKRLRISLSSEYSVMRALGKKLSVTAHFDILPDREVEIFLGLWKELRRTDAGTPTPAEQFEDYGAEVVDPKNVPPPESFAGYADVKERILQNVIIPFANAGVLEKIVEQTRTYKRSIVPRAVLFEGPPGTGKTMMSEIIAGQIGAKFVYVPVDKIFEKWYGESPRNLRKIFELAERQAPCVLFLDEFDALAHQRGGASGTDREDRRVLSVLLTNIDGIKSKPGVLVIGATNLGNDLDAAVRNRFDDIIYFRQPDEKELTDIFALYAKHLGRPELEGLASVAIDFVGRDVSNVAKLAERAWAEQIIKTGKPVTAPPIKCYLDAIDIYKARKPNGLC